MVLGLRAVRNDSLGGDGVANVEFLRRYWPQLADLASLAENYLYTDPNSTMIKTGIDNPEFQRKFTYFYRLRRDEEWRRK